MRKITLAIGVLLMLAFAVAGQDMNLQEGLTLKYLVQLPAHATAHDPVIVILHGYGSDEQDMFGLRSVLPANYIIVAARAPYALPGGGYQWFEKEVAGGKYNGRKQDLDNSRGLIAKFVGEVVAKYHADGKGVYLMGFSQGAIMSYQVGLTHPSLFKGIGVLSGVLFPSLKPMIKITPELNKLKIFVAHGTADNRLPFGDGKEGADYLKSIGLKPEFHEYPGMAHTISKEVISDLNKWLK